MKASTKTCLTLVVLLKQVYGDHFQIQMDWGGWNPDPQLVFSQEHSDSPIAFLDPSGLSSAEMQNNFQCANDWCSNGDAVNHTNIYMTDGNELMVLAESISESIFEVSNVGNVNFQMSWDTSGENVIFYVNGDVATACCQSEKSGDYYNITLTTSSSCETDYSVCDSIMGPWYISW